MDKRITKRVIEDIKREAKRRTSANPGTRLNQHLNPAAVSVAGVRSFHEAITAFKRDEKNKLTRSAFSRVESAAKKDPQSETAQDGFVERAAEAAGVAYDPLTGLSTVEREQYYGWMAQILHREVLEIYPESRDYFSDADFDDDGDDF